MFMGGEETNDLYESPDVQSANSCPGSTLNHGPHHVEGGPNVQQIR
jgi:hypothetical protein